MPSTAFLGFADVSAYLTTTAYHTSLPEVLRTAIIAMEDRITEVKELALHYGVEKIGILELNAFKVGDQVTRSSSKVLTVKETKGHDGFIKLSNNTFCLPSSLTIQ